MTQSKTKAQDKKDEYGWMENEYLSKSMRILFVAFFVVFILFYLIPYILLILSLGEILFLFLITAGIYWPIILYLNSKEPLYIAISEEGIHFRYKNGNERHIKWEDIKEVYFVYNNRFARRRIIHKDGKETNLAFVDYKLSKEIQRRHKEKMLLIKSGDLMTQSKTKAQDKKDEYEWMENEYFSKSMRILCVELFIVFVLLASILYILIFLYTDEILFLFLIYTGICWQIILYLNSKEPRYIAISEEGIHFRYKNGNERHIKWEDIKEVYFVYNNRFGGRRIIHKDGEETNLGFVDYKLAKEIQRRHKEKMFKNKEM